VVFAAFDVSCCLYNLQINYGFFTFVIHVTAVIRKDIHSIVLMLQNKIHFTLGQMHVNDFKVVFSEMSADISIS